VRLEILEEVDCVGCGKRLSACYSTDPTTGIITKYISYTVGRIKCTNSLTQFLFILLELLQVRLFKVRPVPRCKLLETVAAELLQARCPSCHPTNSTKALKDELCLLT